MSSRRTGVSPLPGSRMRSARMADPDMRPGAGAALPAKKKRGRRQPEAGDFQVMCELPPSLPISDRELRAIEVLLGSELRDLLADSLDRDYDLAAK